ncbi:hypothetical protein BC628DRAFT_1050804 [Trametes gibbosa]|nr:hypothetical protein BC628DRAFT_1050804 [Trametes gibbosa]
MLSIAKDLLAHGRCARPAGLGDDPDQHRRRSCCLRAGTDASTSRARPRARAPTYLPPPSPLSPSTKQGVVDGAVPGAIVSARYFSSARRCTRTTPSARAALCLSRSFHVCRGVRTAGVEAPKPTIDCDIHTYLGQRGARASRRRSDPRRRAPSTTSKHRHLCAQQRAAQHSRRPPPPPPPPLWLAMAFQALRVDVVRGMYGTGRRATGWMAMFPPVAACARRRILPGRMKETVGWVDWRRGREREKRRGDA